MFTFISYRKMNSDCEIKFYIDMWTNCEIEALKFEYWIGNYMQEGGKA